METWSCFIHTQPSLFHSRTIFGFRTKTMKSRPHQTKIIQPRTSTQPISASFDSRNPSLLDKIFNTLDESIIKFLDPSLHLSVDPSYILTDNYAPVDELSPTECEVIHGSIPPCLDGVYIRNGPNPQFHPRGPFHYFDGDGMVHSVRISKGQATFCSRYVKTNKYQFEHQVRHHVVPNVFGGLRNLCPFLARVALFVARVLSGNYDLGKGIGLANINIGFFGGRLYALCESDLPYEIKVEEDGDIITLGHHDFDGKLSMNMTAHPKIDPETKEAFAFRYWATPPYLTYFRFDANGNKQPDVPIFSMKQPSLTHDLAITQKYAIIGDIQIGANPINLIRGQRIVTVDLTKVPRIGVLPRYAKDESDMKWFVVPGFNILHAVNAWDDTDEDGNDVVVLVATNMHPVEHLIDRQDLIETSMEKVRIRFGSEDVVRETMSSDHDNLDFGVINPGYVGKRNRYVYAARFEQEPVKVRMRRVSGVVKLDMVRDGHIVGCRMYGDNWFGGEPFFVARNPNSDEEDDGYVVCYVHNERLGESRLLVMDAQSETLEVVAAVKLPQRVPYGFHGIFIGENELNEM